MYDGVVETHHEPTLAGVLQNDQFVQSCTKLTLPKTSRKPAAALLKKRFTALTLTLEATTWKIPYDAKC